ncbi:hypothetical protein D9Q98_008654 [Chlorella vulgaris]|uniref:Uncharacterized protein n=1 Tax=Chlorella vulgaris TaxID=3077 RepID=A0A9D4TID6_CHLVU|nr:hypothetical protein D9Q98_008654 [Chlorella vulgaris]
MLERWNTHFSTVVEQELFGIEFQLAQDPASNNLGTTVWDASIVLAKYIEKNSRRGDFSRTKVRGRQCLELGAGMGLAGMAMALQGADVAFTDIGDVLPLLRRNVEQNISTAALKLKDAAWAAAEVGKARVASLDWSCPACYADFSPPYDFILAADCVYSELAVPHLLATVLHMSGPRTQTIITNEFRSQSVHDIFMQQFGNHFAIRKVALGKMDPNFQHPLIHIYLLKRRKQALEEGQQQEQKEDEALMAAEADTAARGANEAQQGLEEVAAPTTSVAAVADAPAASVAAASASTARADCHRRMMKVNTAPAPAPDFAPAPAPAPAGEDAADAGLLAPEEDTSTGTLTSGLDDSPPEDQSPDQQTSDTSSDNGDLTIQSGGSLATQGPVPPAEGFTPVRVPAADRGTCNLKPQQNMMCDSGMGTEDGTVPSDYQLLADPDQVERCGAIPMTSVVQSIAEWAYRGRWGGCKVTAFTTARVCVGQGNAAGRWRARILLYPDSDNCKKLCVKMTGAGNSVVNYGRTASC